MVGGVAVVGSADSRDAETDTDEAGRSQKVEEFRVHRCVYITEVFTKSVSVRSSMSVARLSTQEPNSHLSENSDVGQQQRCNTDEFTYGHGYLKVVRVVADSQQRTNAAGDPDEGQHRGESPDFSAGLPASPLPDEERGGKDEREHDKLEDGNAVAVGHSAHC